MNKNPLVSVIIACKNNEKYIRQSLESVKAQTYTNWELIIVDNFSTDKTLEIAKEYTDKVYQLGPERSTQFNYGFTKSKGELIYRIGAEFRLEPDVIQKCVDVIGAGFDSIAVHNRSVGDSVWAKVR
jgi:glycosyltransferase involved in cell wall biosynthesis